MGNPAEKNDPQPESEKIVSQGVDSGQQKFRIVSCSFQKETFVCDQKETGAKRRSDGEGQWVWLWDRERVLSSRCRHRVANSV